MGGEAVVFLDPAMARDYLYIRKQSMQLNSKMRFVSAQLLALLDDDLWLRSAGHANAMPAGWRMGSPASPGWRSSTPNAVFARLSTAAIAPLQERYPFYVWDEAEHVVRWMCSWDTREADVDAFASSVGELAQL
jgi:threonine aldolase